jgi:hypothetical protein
LSGSDRPCLFYFSLFLSAVSAEIEVEPVKKIALGQYGNDDYSQNNKNPEARKGDIAQSICFAVLDSAKQKYEKESKDDHKERKAV